MVVTFTSNNGKMTGQVNGIDRAGSPAVYYSFDKGNTFLHLTPTVAAVTTYRVLGLYADSTSHECQYISDNVGELSIPLQKWMKIAMTKPLLQRYVILRIYATIDGVDDRMDMYLNVLPGISYNDLLAPRQKEINDMYQGLMHRTVVPPNVMIFPSLGLGSLELIFESSYGDISLYGSNPIGTWTANNYGGTTTALTPSGTRNNEIHVGSKAESVTFDDGDDVTRTWPIDRVDDCTDLVVLRWTSLTGATRQHAFPFFAIENNVEERVGLVTVGDGFKVAKNVSNGFVIRLTGLTAYSVWYYNDMMNANDLHATIDGTGITTEQTLAMVDGSTAVMPQGNGFFTFEAKIKYRHYDTF